jgi:hypothetical protein
VERKHRLPRLVRAALDVVLAAGLVYIGSLLVSTATGAAERREQLRMVRTEARELYRAFNAYYERNRGYPNAWVEPRFDVASLDPLQRRGYYRGHLLANLHRNRADAYDSPDDTGPNHEFWLELSLACDASIRVVIANSDDAPLGGGKWLDGVFVYRDGVLEPL